MNVQDYIKQHTHINYCEALIFPDGSIENSIPSHTEALIRTTKLDRNTLNSIMPIEADVVSWLVDYTNCVALWFHDGLLPENITNEQINTINELVKHNILAKPYIGYKKKEVSTINRNNHYMKTGEFYEVTKETIAFQ